MNLLELSEQEIIRRNSMEQLRNMGIEPYPAAEYVTNAFSKEIKENFKDDAEPRPVCIAGRIMSRRIMGKASFMELQDSEGRIQVYISRDDICPDENKDFYNVVFKKLMDIGDFIGVKGFVFRTQMGEISVHAQELTVLSKSLKNNFIKNPLLCVCKRFNYSASSVIRKRIFNYRDIFFFCEVIYMT